MTERGAGPSYHRELLARLDREQDRLRDEDDPAAPGAFPAPALPALPPGAVRALLPANASPMAPQDPERRALFEAHLAELARQADVHAPPIPEAVDPPPSGREALSANACTACRGSCCRSGGDHAFLTEDTLVRRLRADPRCTKEDVVAFYLSRLPAETVLDSCVYHGAAGCGLPREWRSTTCNQHFCGKLQQLRALLPEHRPPQVLAQLIEGGRRVRTALIDEQGLKILSEP